MAFKRTSFKSLIYVEKRKKEEIRHKNVAKKQQKREENMSGKVERLARRMHVSQAILECLKEYMDMKTITDEELEIYINTLKWMCRVTEKMKCQLFNITGNPSYLIDIDSLYAGIRQIQEKRSSEAGS